MFFVNDLRSRAPYNFTARLKRNRDGKKKIERILKDI